MRSWRRCTVIPTTRPCVPCSPKLRGPRGVNDRKCTL
jgi:hypothetical protein